MTTDGSIPAKKRKKRIITFIYATGPETSAKIGLVTSEVSEATLTQAWRRIAGANSLPAQSFLGAVSGDKTLLEDKLRKPSYAELQAQLAALQAASMDKE